MEMALNYVLFWPFSEILVLSDSSKVNDFDYKLLLSPGKTQLFVSIRLFKAHFDDDMLQDKFATQLLHIADFATYCLLMFMNC